MEKLRPKAVIFDLGSTLIEYESVPWPDLMVECQRRVFDELVVLGHRFDETELDRSFAAIRDELRNRAAETLREWDMPGVLAALARELQLPDDGGIGDRLFDAYYRPVDEKLFVYDDTVRTLEILRSRVNRIGLISNTIFPRRTHEYELERFGIAPYLDFTIFSSEFGWRKPHPDIFIEAANQAGFAPSECVYVGDRYIEDVTGPAGVGMPAILKLLPSREYPEQMPEAVRRVQSLSEVLDYLDI